MLFNEWVACDGIVHSWVLALFVCRNCPVLPSPRAEMAWAWVAWVGDMLQKIFSDLSCPLARAPWPLEPLPTVVTVITNTKITHTHTPMDGWVGGWMDIHDRFECMLTWMQVLERQGKIEVISEECSVLPVHLQ